MVNRRQAPPSQYNNGNQVYINFTKDARVKREGKYIRVP